MNYVLAHSVRDVTSTDLQDDVLAQVLVRETDDLAVRLPGTEPQLKRRRETVRLEVECELD